MEKMKTRLLCFLAALMLVGLTACGKDKPAADPNLLKLGDYTLLYKGAYITEDYDGNDALVLTLDYTNNGKENASYLWGISETAMQNGIQLEAATIFTDFDAYETLLDDQMKEVAPGATLELQTAFVLEDTTNPVEVTFELWFGNKKGKITIDPSTLSRKDGSNAATLPAETDETLLDWWNGDWYGWWKMTDCTGGYAEMEGEWWDICGTIDLDEDYVGTVELWDEDYTSDDSMVSAVVSLSEAGTGEHGTLYSEGGWFTDVALEHADWIVDPDLTGYENLILIDGWYENGEDSYKYEIYLRPWGYLWDDVDEDSLPDYYRSWYLPLIEAGEAMPDSIDTKTLPPDNRYGLSNPEATGEAALEDMRAVFAVLTDWDTECDYTKARDMLGSDGVPWKDLESAWNAERHSYKWTSADGDFLNITFKIEDGKELYSSCTYSSAVAEGND